MRNSLEWLAYSVAVLLAAIAIAGTPSWLHPFTDVCELATILGALTMGALFATRFMGRPGVAIERQWLAAFLAGMPLVYVVSWLTAAPEARQVTWFWLGVELLGLLVFGAFALLGLVRSPWYLVVGIALHGLVWDSWHYVAASQAFDSAPNYVPAWYARGCFLVDLGIALYLSVRIWGGPARRRVTAESPP